MAKSSNGWTSQPVTGKRMSAVSYVLSDVTSAIDSGEIRIGERLPSESALAARYSVSRAVVREVLRSCEARGLTVTRVGKGTFVVARRPVELTFAGYTSAHLMEARPAIEVPAAALAALRRTDEQVATLQHLLDRMDSEDDPEIWTRLDATFHLTIAQASGNPVFVDVMSSIGSAVSGQSKQLNIQANRRDSSSAEHRAIAGAIGRGSAVEAEDAMRYHLDEVRDALAVALTTRP